MCVDIYRRNEAHKIQVLIYNVFMCAQRRQIGLFICAVWSGSSMSAWGGFVSLS